MSLRIFNESNYCTNGATLAISVWGKSGLGYFCPITGHSCPMKRIRPTLNQYCLRGITSFRIRLDLALFLFQNKDVRTFQNMVRNYKRKSDRAKYSADNLQRSLEAVKTNNCRYEQLLSNLGFPERPYKNH